MSVNINDPEFNKALYRWTGGNQDAIRLIKQFCVLAREVDDLVDEATDVNDKQARISRILELSLVHVATNPFFVQFNSMFIPIIFEMITYWNISDEFKKSKDEQKQIFGYVWRESTDRLIVAVVGVIFGSEACIQATKELFELTHAVSTESLEDWVAEGADDGTVC